MCRFLPLLLVLAAHTLVAQTPDTTRASPADTTIVADTVKDHARNRLLAMSTGETAEKGSKWFGIHELVLFKGGFAPTDFLQIDLMVAPFGYAFVAIGVKAQVLRKNGLFRGLSVGGDIGKLFYETADADEGLMGSYNIATSFGNDEIAMHLNLTNVTVFVPSGRTGMPNLVQLGVSLRYPDAPKVKLMVEGWFVNDNGPGEPFEPEFETVMAGLRFTNRRFVWELGGFLVSGLSITGDGPGSTFIIPYVSGVWNF